jgi:hypothetical protein
MGVESDQSDGDPLPDAVVEEAARLTRLAREADRWEASDPESGQAATREAKDRPEAEAYRGEREALLADYDYTARVREDNDGAVLVLHPDEWVEDGTAQVERIEDVSLGIEVPLGGPGEASDWEAVEADNREVAETVAEKYGQPHGATAHALADFASNHYVKRLNSLTREERREFREEYFPRNAWPTRAQRDTLAESIRLAVDATADRSHTSGRE